MKSIHIPNQQEKLKWFTPALLFRSQPIANELPTHCGPRELRMKYLAYTDTPKNSLQERRGCNPSTTRKNPENSKVKKVYFSINKICECSIWAHSPYERSQEREGGCLWSRAQHSKGYSTESLRNQLHSHIHPCSVFLFKNASIYSKNRLKRPT